MHKSGLPFLIRERGGSCQKIAPGGPKTGTCPPAQCWGCLHLWHMQETKIKLLEAEIRDLKSGKAAKVIEGLRSITTSVQARPLSMSVGNSRAAVPPWPTEGPLIVRASLRTRVVHAFRGSCNESSARVFFLRWSSLHRCGGFSISGFLHTPKGILVSKRLCGLGSTIGAYPPGVAPSCLLATRLRRWTSCRARWGSAWTPTPASATW